MDYGYSIGGVIIFILDIWAVLNIVQSGTSPVEKIIWILLIILLPLIGFVIWFLAGPGGRRIRV